MKTATAKAIPLLLVLSLGSCLPREKRGVVLVVGWGSKGLRAVPTNLEIVEFRCAWDCRGFPAGVNLLRDPRVQIFPRCLYLSG